MKATHAFLTVTALGLAGLGAPAPTLGQTPAVPSGPPRSVVMMQPIPDAGAGAGGNTAALGGGARPSTIRVLSATDRDLYQRAYALAAAKNWPAALALANQGQDTTARQLLQWRYALDRDSGANFAQIDAALKMATGWPLRGTLQARAEAAITPDMGAEQVTAWFTGRNPNSSIGRIRLGEALGSQTARGAAQIRQGWSEGGFEPDVEADIVARDGAVLTPESHRARLDALLWRDEIGAAQRQIARVDAQTAAIARARIALKGGYARAAKALETVSGSSDAALLFDWSRALRVAGRNDEARRMLLRVASAPMLGGHTARWWAETNAQARDALRDDPRLALALVEHAGLAPGGDPYAEQQFLGGFIALRFLKEPKTALGYFQRLGANVARPISKSRAEYWQGRAHEALGDTTAAQTHYRLAAAWPDAFYGQLALARSQTAPVLHLTDTPVDAASRAEVESDPLMPQIRVLADLGQAGDLRLFVDADAQVYSSPRHIKQLMTMLTEWGYPEIALRLAKTASYAGAPILAFTHPLLVLPRYPGPGAAPEPSLVLGLIRQETEFDPYAVSSAGARGLMQMMPASARKAARDAGLPYRPEALLTDSAYNMQLGMIEYAGHLATWNGSLVLAAASYNAGPGNARKWIAANGDPRSGSVDAIDWIEQISFGETRNYVQRVLENMEVYRNRLAGKDMPLQIMGDLYAPASPPARNSGN